MAIALSVAQSHNRIGFRRIPTTLPHANRTAMSYDLTIKGDDSYSRSTVKATTDSFIAQLPNIKPNGDHGFALDGLPDRWMEIDLEIVSEEGDSIRENWRDGDEINCISLHIPYQFLGDAPERDYFPIAIAIADHLGWELYDEQTGELVPRGPAPRKPWWRFW